MGERRLLTCQVRGGMVVGMDDFIAARREFNEALYALRPMEIRGPGVSTVRDPGAWDRFTASARRLEAVKATHGLR